MTCDCPCDLTFPWQPYFTGMFLFISITFELTLVGFLRFWTNPEIKLADHDGRQSEMVMQLLCHVMS